METFSALLAFCAGNSPVPREFPSQRPVTRSFDVFVDLHVNKQLSKQSRRWWFETQSYPLWHHCTAILAVVVEVYGLGRDQAWVISTCSCCITGRNEFLHILLDYCHQNSHGISRWKREFGPASFPWHGPWNSRNTQRRYTSRIHFTNCLLAHSWNVVVIRFALILIQIPYQICPCNGSSDVVACVQNSDLLWLELFLRAT